MTEPKNVATQQILARWYRNGSERIKVFEVRELSASAVAALPHIFTTWGEKSSADVNSVIHTVRKREAEPTVQDVNEELITFASECIGTAVREIEAGLKEGITTGWESRLAVLPEEELSRMTAAIESEREKQLAAIDEKDRLEKARRRWLRDEAESWLKTYGTPSEQERFAAKLLSEKAIVCRMTDLEFAWVPQGSIWRPLPPTGVVVAEEAYESEWRLFRLIQSAAPEGRQPALEIYHGARGESAYIKAERRTPAGRSLVRWFMTEGCWRMFIKPKPKTPKRRTKRPGKRKGAARRSR